MRMNRNLREPYTHVDNRAMNISTVSSRLDEAMTKAGFSQSGLARASGVPQPTINRILKGPNKRGPETDTLRKLAQACNVSFDWLNEGIGQPARSGPARVAELPTAQQVQPPQESWLHRVNADEALLLELYRSLSKPKQAAAVGYMKIAAGKNAAKSDVSTTGPDQAEHGAQRK
jgi:transcriptional regulator with XRE-family HTH domain